VILSVLLLALLGGPSAPSDQLCVAFTGDLMHHCAQAPAARRAAGGEGHDYRGSFEHVADILSAADLAIGNLETPVDGAFEDHCFPRFSAPLEYLYALSDAGFDVLSLANNHALDRGSDGLARTALRVAHRGVYPVGTTAHPQVTITVKGVRVAVLAATERSNRPCEEALCPVMIGSGARLAQRVALAAMDHDLVVVLLHWMREYQEVADDATWALTRRLVEAGAHAVVGSHPHVLAEVEAIHLTTRRAFTRYSLGNFLAAGKSFTTRLAGIDRVCFERTPSGWTLADHEFVATVVRKDAGKARPDVYQPIPLAAALAQCASGEGPFPRLRNWECADLRWFREHLDRHRDRETLPSATP
jgi:hypothetical protein